MALTKSNSAAGAAPAAAKTPEPAAPEQTQDTAVPELDDDGNAINEGDANGRPLNSQAAKTPDPDDQEDDDEEEEPAERLIKVTNLSKNDLRQPSTGIWIAAGERRGLREDGWMRNQINAGLLTKKKA